MSKDKKDKLKGLFFGLALGDSLGAPHEFRYHTDVYTGKLTYRIKYISRFQGVRYSAIGQITDDTEMSIALSQSIIENKGYDRDAVIKEYEQWANTS